MSGCRRLAAESTDFRYFLVLAHEGCQKILSLSRSPGWLALRRRDLPLLATQPPDGYFVSTDSRLPAQLLKSSNRRTLLSTRRRGPRLTASCYSPRGCWLT